MTIGLDQAKQIAEQIAGRAAAYDELAEFPVDDIGDLRACGLLGLMVPSELGGLGGGFADYVEVARVLGSANAATALVFNMHASVTGALAEVSPELVRALGASEEFLEERDAILRSAADGAMYGVAISEAGVGSRLSQLATTYEADGSGYRITGDKVACSGVGHLDGYLVAARSAGDGALVSYFLLPGDAVEAHGEWNPLGMRATASRAARVNAWVPAGSLLGGIEGLVVPLAYASPQWLVASYAAVYVGLCEAILTEAAAYLTATGRTGRASRDRLGRADAAIAGARLAVQHAARLVEDRPGDRETNRAIYRAKLLAGDTVIDVAVGLTEACGLGALSRGSALERAFHDARFGAVMPPRSDVCAEYLGVDLFGLDPQSNMDERPW